VVGPNRFLRRYTGNTATPGAEAWVEAVVAHPRGRRMAGEPRLELCLTNGAKKDVTFTLTFNRYTTRSPQSVTVRAHGRDSWVLEACGESEGWYDLTITVSSDASWSQRLTGHLESGRASVSG